MKKFWLILIVVLLVSLVAGGGFWWRQKTQAAKNSPTDSTQQGTIQNAESVKSSRRSGGGDSGEGTDSSRPITVQTAAATRRDIKIILTGLGTVQGFNTAILRSRVDGQITEIAFNEGQEVVAGQVLVRLDSRSADAALAQAIANLHRDQSQLAIAVANNERTKRLGESGVATQQTIEAAEAQVQQLKALVESDQAAVAAATAMQSHYTIRAPFAGRTGIRNIDIGNILHAADPNGIVSIAQISPISVAFSLPEKYFSRIIQRLESRKQNRQKLLVTAYGSDSEKPIEQGELVAVDNQIDTTTGTIHLKAKFQNSQRSLWPGQFISLRLILDTKIAAVAIPDSAIQQGADHAFVYLVMANGRVARRTIKASVSDGGFTAIDEGLEAGEIVVTDGQYRLKDGAAVTLAKP